MKNSQRRNHARGTAGRPGPETQGPSGQAAGQSGEAASKGDGGKLEAEEIYRETWLWLKARHCEKLVSPQLISQYAMAVSRWIQCEHAISEYGFLAKHPTTNAAIASPYVTMSQNYMKQVNQIWYQIYQVVKENCSVEFSGNTPQDDVMERLLRSRKV